MNLDLWLKQYDIELCCRLEDEMYWIKIVLNKNVLKRIKLCLCLFYKN